MKNRSLLLVLVGMVILGLTGCNPSPSASAYTPFVFPSLAPSTLQPSSTPLIQTQDLALPSLTPGIQAPGALASKTATPATTAEPDDIYVILPGEPSGPYAVIQVLAGDVLNIRSSPGKNKSVVGAFSATTTEVMRSGPSALIGDELWVEVEKPGGGVGWISSYFLTEHVSAETFCTDNRVTSLINELGVSLRTSDGILLGSLVSPNHGLDVRLWRYSQPINYDQIFAEWVFVSTYAHNWGPAPGSGEDEIGAFHDIILPLLLEVYNAGYTPLCNDPGNAAAFSLEPWPYEYTNINFINLYKPGTDQYGEMDWRSWLAGVEYVQGRPYLFSLINFQWEP